MCPAGDHRVRVAAPDQGGGLAERLRAGGTRRQRVEVRSLGAEAVGDVTGGTVGVLLKLAHGVESLVGHLGPLHGVELAALRVPAGDGGGHEVLEIDRTLSSAQIHADHRRIHTQRTVQPGVLPGHLGCRQREAGVAAGVLVILEVLAEKRPQVQVLHLGGELGGIGARVEDGSRGHARLASQQPLPNRLQAHAQRGDPAHARDNDASVHSAFPICGTA